MSSAVQDPPVSPLRQALDGARARCASAVAAGERGSKVAETFSQEVFGLVARASARVLESLPGGHGPVAVVAIGALGRDELGPESDLDLVVLTPLFAGTGEPALEELVRQLVHPLWDAGLRVSPVVQDPTAWLEAGVDDLTVATSLLDVALLAGDASLVHNLQEQARERFFDGQRAAFLHRLAQEVDDRHARYGSTVYKVEPDLKHGPGGIRDLSVVRWCLLATHGHADLERLADEGHMGVRVAGAISRARDTLLRLRAALHLSVGRASDRLVFEHQERMPRALGQVPADGAVADDVLVQAIESFMQDYYGAARDVLRYGRRACEACVPPRESPAPEQRIDERFFVLDHRLHTYERELFDASPALALEALIAARKYGARLSGDLFDAIAEAAAAPAAAALATEPAAHRRFFRLLIGNDEQSEPGSLQLLNELGLLERIIPEFGPSRARMQHDTYHVYTVDQHSLEAVNFLKAVARGDYRKEYPLATAMHFEVEDPRVLYLATLLHDVGKALGGDQCETGAEVNLKVAQRLGLCEEDARRAEFLVRQHITMPMLSQRRDLSDPLLIEAFGCQLPSAGALRELYLLSLADMTQVRPGFVTTWKLALLDELYLRTRAFLHRGASHDPPRVARVAEPQGLPGRYYALYDAELRTKHERLVAEVVDGERAVAMALEEAPGGYRLTVAARDQPGLLAKVAASANDLGLEFLAADVFSVPGGVALDVFRVRPRDDAQQLDQTMVVALESAVTGSDVRLDEVLPPLPRTRARGMRKVETQVSFDSDGAGASTIVEVQTADQPGVLMRITRAFARCGIDISLARLLTEAGRVTDVFYVSPLSEQARTELTRCLHEDLARA